MTILHIFEGASFDSNATKARGSAFDVACKALHKLGADEALQETIAKRIVGTAKKGERDPRPALRAGPVGNGHRRDNVEAVGSVGPGRPPGLRSKITRVA